VLTTSSRLGIELSFDLTDLAMDLPVIFGYAVRQSDRAAGSVDVVVAIIPSGALAEETDAHGPEIRQNNSDRS